MRARGRRGVQAVEFAIVTPFLLGLLTAVMDYGWYFHHAAVVNTAVRDAARQGAVTAVEQSAIKAQDVACAALYAERLVAQAAGCSEVTTRVTTTNAVSTVYVAANVPFRPIAGLLPTPGALQVTLTMHHEGE